jgi:hypothetical protein
MASPPPRRSQQKSRLRSFRFFRLIEGQGFVKGFHDPCREAVFHPAPSLLPLKSFSSTTRIN